MSTFIGKMVFANFNFKTTLFNTKYLRISTKPQSYAKHWGCLYLVRILMANFVKLLNERVARGVTSDVKEFKSNRAHYPKPSAPSTYWNSWGIKELRNQMASWKISTREVLCTCTLYFIFEHFIFIMFEFSVRNFLRGADDKGIVPI